MPLPLPRRALALGLLLSVAACRGGAPGDGKAQADQPRKGEIALQITNGAGEKRAFIVELAVTEPEQERGLMERRSLADNRGMLFPFAFPATANFWMKNTPLPLDLLFIRPDGTIAAILPGMPNDLHPLTAGEPVSAVLEIRQGRAQALGIGPGDRVQWGDCANGAASPAGVWEADRFCPAPSR
ncbi:DUF192 domain-containing protein [Sphingobium nicotianae]|uniref:DUF192 domain-containing protein n=1 Tax=Sphingobium nicotianae TaxID=2782607 RepID=A0A9X1AIM9_9SPHN|nr:DUF192 domain-containing protein [Sphingobium nicotianae]MBT2185380.1 DUF192 domain-containing protein [Sphingobium nicotianae]